MPDDFKVGDVVIIRPKISTPLMDAFAGKTATIVAIRPDVRTKAGKPIFALMSTHLVEFPETLGMKTAWFEPDELERLDSE